MTKTIRIMGTAAVGALWIALTLAAWLLPARDISDAERRKLAQFPELSTETVMDGSFMADFEDYTLDQFPMRDSFRKLKSVFHYYGLGQKDNNDIYIVDGYAAKMEYPFRETSAEYAIKRFQALYDKYLKDSNSAIYMSIVPDKGYYLADKGGNLSMDYTAMFTHFESGMPWATHVDITGDLDFGDYYRTDTHWRQEKLLKAAGTLCDAMGVTAPKAEDYTQVALDKPFYGVYYGQAALPMEPETIYLMESKLLSQCTVYDYESGKTGAIYDRNKLLSRDLYDVYLSGARSLLTIHNPNAATDRELIVFRDSFGSSMVPLLVQDYAKVTLVDIRYIHPDILGRFLEFHGQDVLFLYSTLVLNSSSSLK